MKLPCRRLISLINNTSLVVIYRETGSQAGFLQPLKRSNKGKSWGLPMLKPLAVPNSQQKNPTLFPLEPGSGRGTSPVAALMCGLPLLGSAESKTTGFYNLKILLHKHDNLLSPPKNNTTQTSLHFSSSVPVCFMYLYGTGVMWSWAQRKVTHGTVCSCFVSEANVPFGHYKKCLYTYSCTEIVFKTSSLVFSSTDMHFNT